ncbi:MAG: uroporphyrinogen-III C-methyltransferase [Microthrixaceae bacterium]
MSGYLLAWDLRGRRVLVVGAGSIAEGKIETLRGTGADIVVVGPAPTPRVRDLAAAGTIRLSTREVRRRDVVGARLVVAATDDRSVNRRVRRWAHAVRAVVNVVDDPALCDVTVPATVRRGAATIAVTTDGASPAAARFLREEIERAVPPRVDELVDQAASARRELRWSGTYRYDYPAWRQRLFEPGMREVAEGRIASLGELRRRFLAGFGSTTPIRTGSVTLVGAGPGGADLITMRGAAALARADVVVYDRLADPALLDLAPVVAVRIPVGKAKGSGTDQEVINATLIEHAKRGSHVVRLKGGDPFVFGRGSEERDAVVAAGLACDVVPGLSSSMSGPALAGIPLTHRGMSASFTVLSGHRVAEADHDWDALARSGSTLVVLMGASTASEIATRLLAGGRPADEPVALVHRAGRPDARTIVSTLCELRDGGCPLPAPVVIVIGQVVTLADPTTMVAPANGNHVESPSSMVAAPPPWEQHATIRSLVGNGPCTNRDQRSPTSDDPAHAHRTSG